MPPAHVGRPAVRARVSGHPRPTPTSGVRTFAPSPLVRRTAVAEFAAPRPDAFLVRSTPEEVQTGASVTAKAPRRGGETAIRLGHPSHGAACLVASADVAAKRRKPPSPLAKSCRPGPTKRVLAPALAHKVGPMGASLTSSGQGFRCGLPSSGRQTKAAGFRRRRTAAGTPTATSRPNRVPRRSTKSLVLPLALIQTSSDLGLSA